MSTLKTINVIHPSSSTTNIVNDASGNVSVGNNLTVAGTATVTGTLGATGATTLSDTLAVTGATTLSNTLAVTGATTFAAYTETVIAIGTVTTATTLSIALGTLLTATLTASTACTFTMPTATAGKSFVLLLKQAASTGNGTATFTGVKWNSAGAPTITATAGKMDIISFVSDGTNWYGSISQGFTP